MKKKMMTNNKIEFLYNHMLKIFNHSYIKLLDHDYLIIDENYSHIIIRFRKKDYVHLTGIKLNIKDSSFFHMIKSKTFRKNNIQNQQKYSFREIKKKLNNLIKMCNVFQYGSKSLLLKKIHTNTRDYPYGIVGDNFILCLDGNKKYYPESIRDDKINTQYDDVLNIYAVYKKRNSSLEYKDCIYLHCDASIENINNILQKLNKNKVLVIA